LSGPQPRSSNTPVCPPVARWWSTMNLITWVG
jgi:hypothetical protein